MSQKRLAVVGVICALIAVALIIRLMSGSGSAKPPPSASGYYTGPMVNKSGTAITTEDGKIVQYLQKDRGNQGTRGRSTTDSANKNKSE